MVELYQDTDFIVDFSLNFYSQSNYFDDLVLAFSNAYIVFLSLLTFALLLLFLAFPLLLIAQTFSLLLMEPF